MKLLEWINNTLPLVQTRMVDKVEMVLEDGKAQIYWAGTIIRIDFKPKGGDQP